MSLQARTDIHLARRLWHFFGVMAIAVVAWILPSRQAILASLALATIAITLDVCRLYSPKLNRILTWAFKPFMRESERNRLAGSSFMLAGVTLIVLLFPKQVVLLTLLFLATADPLASYFGIRFGKDKLIGGKSLQGSLAAFVTCFTVSLAYYLALNLMHDRLFIVCLLSALIGAVSELVPFGRLDDNFIFPVLSGSMLTGLFYIFGGL